MMHKKEPAINDHEKIADSIRKYLGLRIKSIEGTWFNTESI